MAQRMLILNHVIVLYILLNSIQHIYVYGKDCRIMRDKRDKIIPVSKTLCTPSNNPCSKFSGTLVLGETECTCICPTTRPTYVETTNNCSAYSDVWSKCNLSFRRQLLAIPKFSMNLSASLRLNIPKKFRRCKMAASRENSFYFNGSGWNQVPQEYNFPFLVETRIRKRLQLAYVKWKTKVPSELIKGKVFRIGITCGKKLDCVMLKITGKTIDQCMADPTDPTPTNQPSSSSPSFMPSASNGPTTKYLIASQPSLSNKNSRESSSVKIPWSVIGTVVGILVVLSICIIILAVCFCRRRKKLLQKKRNGIASTQSSGVTLSSAESQPEVTYASPHHPYQELKPPLSGTPRGTYQPLKWNAREDASGYMLPSESTASNYPDPLYNEIGSPTRGLPPVYDYALPENTVRLSNPLSNIDLRLNGLPKPGARNDPDYVGRTSPDQEEPKSPSSEGASPAPVNDDPTSPAYLDFTSEGANQPNPFERKKPDNIITKGAPGSSRYKKPVNGPKSPFKQSPSEKRPYQELEPPFSPVYEPPLVLSRKNLEGEHNKESKA